MSASTLQQSGRDAYKRKDYAKAFEYFRRAVGRGDPTAQLLDNLAATHEKLGDLPAALKAAKKAIQAARDDATGYLRAGSILQKMDKRSVALEIYSHGLKSIKHVGQGYEQLKRVHDQLQEELSPKHSVDPLTVLPRELAISMLEQLTFKERVASTRVSSGWLRFIRSEPSLWAHLDLSGAKKKKVSSKFISTAINTARKKLTSATLSRLFDFDKALTALLRSCPIESLTLAETGLQSDNLAVALNRASGLRELHVLSGTEVGQATLYDIARSCSKNLEVIHCAAVASFEFIALVKLLPRLRCLNITARYIGLGNLDTLSQLAPKLTSLTLRHLSNSQERNVSIDLRALTELEYLDIRRVLPIAQLHLLPPSIMTLKLESRWSYNGDYFDYPDVENGVHKLQLPVLRELTLAVPMINFPSAIRALTTSDSTFTKLSHFAIEDAVFPAPDCEPYLEAHVLKAARLDELDSLSLRKCQNLTDEYLGAFLQPLSKLRRLDLSASPITGAAVKGIVKAGRVKELVLNDCRTVARDAVDFARLQGLKVEYKMTPQETVGRKVRYS